MHDAAAALGVTAAQVGLAWLLHHAPNVLLILGTASVAHLEANIAVGEITLDAVPSRTTQITLGAH